MKEILITTLLLGCLIAFTSAQRGLFEFHDSYGRCWRCFPGSACVRCSTSHAPFVRGLPPDWDRTCAQPSPEICAANLGVKFPHVDIGFYWICADEGVIVEAPCFCDLVFDMRQQQCVKADALTSIGCNAYAHSDPHDCLNLEVRPPPVTFPPDVTLPVDTTTVPGGVTTPSVPTAPNDPADTTTTVAGPTQSVPTVTNEGPTTTEYATTTTTTTTTSGPINGDTTTTTSPRTTEVGGPGASPHPEPTTTVSTSGDDSSTTPAPCVCIVWWPCWCNPCWNMPCHSCNGCVGMMG